MKYLKLFEEIESVYYNKSTHFIVTKDEKYVVYLGEFRDTYFGSNYRNGKFDRCFITEIKDFKLFLRNIGYQIMVEKSYGVVKHTIQEQIDKFFEIMRERNMPVLIEDKQVGGYKNSPYTIDDLKPLEFKNGYIRTDINI